MCDKCDGSGSIPLRRKSDNSIVPFAWTYCVCHETHQDDHRRALQPEDIDFTTSYGAYRSLCREHNWQDPGSDYPAEPEKPQEQVITHYHSDLSKQNYDLLQQTALRAIHLEKQLNERMKPKKKPETYGYKGIR